MERETTERQMENSPYTSGMFIVVNGDRFKIGTRMQRVVARQAMREVGADVATVYASHRDGARVFAAPVAWSGADKSLTATGVN